MNESDPKEQNVLRGIVGFICKSHCQRFDFRCALSVAFHSLAGGREGGRGRQTDRDTGGERDLLLAKMHPSVWSLLASHCASHTYVTACWGEEGGEAPQQSYRGALARERRNGPPQRRCMIPAR